MRSFYQPHVILRLKRGVNTALRAAWFWPTLARFAGTWGIFSSPGDPKLTADGLGFQRNGHRWKYGTLGFELLGRNVAPLYFKTERVAETALRASWSWTTLAPFPGTWGIFSRPRDSKLTPDGPCLQRNGHRENDRTLGFELLGRNIAPRVAETALRTSRS